METEDPRAALASAEVAQRTAAARDLALVGTFEDLAALVRAAMDDKSAAVRLHAAAAAADVLSRYRGAFGQGSLDDAQRAQVSAWVKAVDPERNPTLLMLLSAAADAAAVDRLGRNLTRSADSGVRAAAALALRRMALSAGVFDASALEAAARRWAAGRLPPDAQVELVRLAAACGWAGLDALDAPLAAGTRSQAAVVEAASAQRLARSDWTAWEGVYESDGLDVQEAAPGPRADDWGALVGTVWYAPNASVGPGRGKRTAGSAGAGLSARVVVGLPAPRVGDQPARMVFAPRRGDPESRAQAVQWGGRTWWKLDGKALADWAESHLDGLDDALREAVSRWLDGVEGPGADRARAVLLWKSGDLVGARSVLDGLIAHRKPRADVYLLLGRICAALGDRPAAREALGHFLDKAGKKAEGRDEAATLLETLA